HGVSPRWIGDQFARIAYDAGVKHAPFDGVSAHVMRHTAASDVYERTGDVKLVQDLLGHRSLATTEVYTRGLGIERIREAIEGRDYRLAELAVMVGPIVKAAPIVRRLAA